MAEGNPDNDQMRKNPNNEDSKPPTEDHLYHIGLSTVQDDLTKFGDVKFVCFGGTATRMKDFAILIAKELGLQEQQPKNRAKSKDRYVMYKSGPVLCVSHGIGIPSLSIIFEEILKLIRYADCQDVTFFRIGTSGGIGLDPGTVVVSDRVVNGGLQPKHTVIVLGETVDRPAEVDQELADELVDCGRDSKTFRTVKGTTLCADNFYEGQGRMDGAFRDFDENKKKEWLALLNDENVKNIEMESLGFISMCQRANIRGAVCCVTLLDRLKGDGITTDRELLGRQEEYPQILVSRYIKQKLEKQ